jgi:hypothetical protein
MKTPQLNLNEANAKLKRENISNFPVEIYPPFIQDVIFDMHDNANYNIDYFGASIFTAIASSIGNAYHLEPHIEWRENTSLWIVNVGKNGQNKSAPQKTAFKAITKKQSEFNREYKNALENYNPESGEKKPVEKKLYTTDPTFEALVKMHSQNSHGIVVKPDEFKSFISNLTGYNGSSKQSQFLSLWDGSPISNDRKEAESNSVEIPCVSIIGGIQNDVLVKLKAKDTKDGFFERILFVIPLKMEKRPLPDTEINKEINGRFHSKMNLLLENALNSEEIAILKLSPGANKLFVQEVNSHVEPSNKNNIVSGILSKLDRYMLRYSLIIEVSTCIWQDKIVGEISEISMQKAILLKKYFFDNALKLNELILDDYEENSPEGKVFRIIKAIGKEKFPTKEFLKTANELYGIKEAYCYRLLGNTKLAKKEKRGSYETEIELN